jgi:hypothetical protein
MRSRPALAAAAALTLLVAPAVDAVAKAKPKPKPLCTLLTDITGDGKMNLAPVVSSPALDIVSGDIATGSKTMVAVLRLGSTDYSPANDPWARSGYDWYLATTSTLGHSYSFTVSLGYLGTMTPAATVDGQTVAVDFKVVGNTFQWTMQRKLSPDLSRPKNVLHEFRAGSNVESTSADRALTSTTKYPDRASSCVHAD